MRRSAAPKDWPALMNAPCASEARLGGIDADDARRALRRLHMNMRTMSVDVVIGGASPSPACRGVGRSGASRWRRRAWGRRVGVGGGGKAAAGRAGIEAAGGSGGGVRAAARGAPIPAAGSTAGSSGTASAGATPASSTRRRRRRAAARRARRRRLGEGWARIASGASSGQDERAVVVVRCGEKTGCGPFGTSLDAGIGLVAPRAIRGRRRAAASEVSARRG